MKLRLVRYHGGGLLRLMVAFILGGAASLALTPDTRWGQAAVLVDDILFIQGGKTDPFNSYSYTSAPTTNELLSLSLSQPFDASSPPWILFNSSVDISISQGPEVSWHTLSAFNGSGVLLFGGQPGPNSPVVIVDRADSAFILDISNGSNPTWFPQSPSWAGQPVRRIYHSSSTSPSGVVYIVGGEKADGSGLAFSEHYAFDPQVPSFSQLPTENGPLGLYGHASVMLPDGRLLIFGGVVQGSLVELSTVWILDTLQDPLSWTTLQVDSTTLPAPRRAFIAISIGQGRILIQGGSDASLQNNLDDGWILDTSKNPAAWSRIDELSQVGARRDHCAVFSNGLVIFGFGYLNSGPAPGILEVFDLSSSSFVTSYTPPSPTTSVTQTIPGQTWISTGTATHHPGPSTTSDGVNQPSSPVGGEGGSESKKPIAAIAVGTTFGVIGAIAAGVFIVMYSRQLQRKKSGRSFLVIGDDEDGGNSSLHAGSIIPAATMYTVNGPISTQSRWGNGLLGAAFGIAETIGAAGKSRNMRDIQRRDMLADEDTREFADWYHARRRDGSGGSSWSLKSILGNRFRSRDPSTYSHGSGSHRQERTDPFSDAMSLMHDPGSALFEVNGRPKNRREASRLSTSSYSYLDPFADPVAHEKDVVHNVDEYEPISTINTTSQSPPTINTIRMVVPALTSGYPLSPLSEHTSKTSLPSVNLSYPSHLDSETQVDLTTTSHSTIRTTLEPLSSHISSKSSVEAPKSPRLLPSSIIPASVTSPSVHRSDSWWSKLYRPNFLDRASAVRASVMPEIRDPNPPPILDPICETLPQASSNDAPSEVTEVGQQLLGSKSTVYAADPGKSLTSLQTADTERIERMAGAMDVVQRVRTRSQITTGSIGSSLSIDTHETSYDGAGGEEPIPTSSSEVIPRKDNTSPAESSVSLSFSPDQFQQPPIEHARLSILPPAPHYTSIADTRSSSPPFSSSSKPIARSSVAARVQMYERRLSHDQERPPPTNTRQKEERTPKKSRVSVDYGFVPRPNLFVANPDHRNSRSSDS